MVARIHPSPWKNRHPARPGPESPLNKDGRPTWYSCASIAILPWVCFALHYPQPGLLAVCGIVNAVAAANAAQPSLQYTADTQTFLARKGIAVPEREWINPSKEFLVGDARILGAVGGIATFILLRRRFPHRSVTGLALVPWFGNVVGDIAFVYGWPLVFSSDIESGS